MNRSQSAVDVLSRRHVSFDGSLGSQYAKLAASPTPPNGSSHSSSPRAQGSIVLKAIAALVIIFAAGITLGSFAHIEYYRRASVTSSSSNSSGYVQSRIIKRTQQVWALKTETIQDATLQQPKGNGGAASQNGTATATSESVASSTHEQEQAQLPAASSDTSSPQQPEQHEVVQQEYTQQHKQQEVASALQQHNLEQQQQKQQPNTVGAAQGAHDANGLPADFNWRLYLSYYPDLAQHGINDEAKAKAHYMGIGRHEQRIYQSLNVTLRYTACGGLMNQHYSHLDALALAVVLKADIYVPAALSRNSFASYFSTDPTKNKVFWQASPASNMWDLPNLQKYWKDRGIKIMEGPGDARLPDMSRPATAYPTWLPPGFTWDHVAHMGNVYIRSLNMGRLVASALELLVHHVGLHGNDHTKPILLDLPCTLFMLETPSAPDLMPEVARTFRFAPKMYQLADLVIRGMGNITFNGLHLRMEADAKDWANILGGPEKLLRMYIDACHTAGFTTDTGMYLASGIFTYGDFNSKQQEVANQLAEVSNKLHYKELYIPKEELQALTNEQQALIDFLVLAHAKRFVGISVSTFSYYLREYRAVLGMAKSSSVLVDGSRVGTEKLFHRAARVVNLH